MLGLTSKVWVRLMAVLQLMTGLLFLQASLYSYQALDPQQLATGMVNIAICLVLCLLNLVAGWTLLDETKLGTRLSFINLLAQSISVNLPFFAYLYAGVARFAVSLSIHGDPKPDALLGFGFDLFPSNFRISLSQLPNLPTIAISPIAIAFVFYLGKRLRSN